jgi:DNA-directed RNA polymerase subunit RPC12/RpoP
VGVISYSSIGAMNCPECNHEFGYLHLDKLEQVGKLTEFECPNCGQRLNNRPIKEITQKANWYIYGGLTLFVLLLLINYLIYDDQVKGIIKYLLIFVGSASCLLGYLQYGKLDRKINYEKVV